jgi:CubicO group peptidase (beta-lactamase class C family)
VGKEIGRVLVRIRSPAPCGRPRPRRSRRGAIADRRPLLLVAVLVCLLAAACTGPHGRQATATSQGSAGPTQRDYWPTVGWRTAAPDQQGMDPAVLADLDTKVPERYPQVRSLLVVRHGYLVYERYWHGFDASDGQNSHSVTKSVTSALVGIALGEGHLQSLDQTVGELLATHLPPKADPRLRRVTIQQLLTMTSGLASDARPGGRDELLWNRMLGSRDWVRHILGRRLETTPGTSFAYSSAGSQLLSAMVADATGQSTLAYARAKLFGPLGIATENVLVQAVRRWPPTPAELAAYEQVPVAWPTDPQGYHLGFAWLKLPARDLAKFGYLYLNGGRWDRTQVVRADYVRASVQPHSKLPSSRPGDGYGYQWWTTSVDAHRSFVAVGSGGQFIQVIPELDLVVVITSDADQERSDPQFLIEGTIVSAIAH